MSPIDYLVGDVVRGRPGCRRDNGLPVRSSRAETDKPIKVGLIGCGGRGTGAADNAMDADPNVKIVALADVFKDRLDGWREPPRASTRSTRRHCFVGFDAYKKLLDTDVDYVILATPPHYRPEHLEAAVEAGKHVFMEKPVAVDPVGHPQDSSPPARRPRTKKLSIVAGTQRRHQNGYIETIKRIQDGAIGEIVAGPVLLERRAALVQDARGRTGRTSEWMHRDWVNWRWLSGDHIVEQHVHNLDVINWVLGAHPIKVVAMGGRGTAA